MKGTATAVVVGGTVTVASAACIFPVPQDGFFKGVPIESFSCDVSESCCHGLQDAEQVQIKALNAKGQGKGPDGKGEGRMMEDLTGTCGRADQVDLYRCAVATLPKLAPKGKGKMVKAMIKGKGCDNVAAKTGPDGSGKCSIKGGMIEIEGVSTGCCDKVVVMDTSKFSDMDRAMAGQRKMDGEATANDEALLVKMQEEKREQFCGLIGACGKKDQLSMVKFMKSKGKGKGKGGGPGGLELLETFNMTGGAQQMMATFMTSEVEDDVSEDGATEDGSQIVTGLFGFVAGAAVTGLGVTVLRRSTPSQYEYNEIVA